MGSCFTCAGNPARTPARQQDSPHIAESYVDLLLSIRPQRYRQRRCAAQDEQPSLSKYPCRHPVLQKPR